MATKSDAKAALKHRAHLERQRADQARHRAKNKARRRPARDDVANAALRMLLTAAVLRPNQAATWTNALARDLAGLEVPFDPAETAAVFEAMLERRREAMERGDRERVAERKADQ